MLRAAVEGHSRAVVAHDGDRQQHLHVLLHQSLMASLTAYLQAGKFAVFEWLADTGAVPAQFSNSAAFKNFNRPEDLNA